MHWGDLIFGSARAADREWEEMMAYDDEMRRKEREALRARRLEEYDEPEENLPYYCDDDDECIEPEVIYDIWDESEYKKWQ